MAGLNRRLFRVGLTGGIGSGKSTVADILAGLGATLIDTDAIAHGLTGPGGAAIPALVEGFGPDVVNSQGALDRSVMRARVFADPEIRLALESILHPLIRQEVQRQCDQATGAYALVVVPLLVEHLSEYRPLVDRILVVDCSAELQIARTSARPGLNEALARAILATQVSREARLALADDIIKNEGDRATLARQVEALHRRYATLAAG